jgi:branched-chain amino acid aminotransferase
VFSAPLREILIFRYNVPVIHRSILHNDEIRDCADKVLAPGQVGLLAGWGVFSTLRVKDGVLFAFERHWARMSRDAALLRVALPQDPEAVHRNLLKLVDANRAHNSTMRLVVVRNVGGMWEGAGNKRASDLIALTADLKEWGASVRLTYVPQGRHAASRFAGVKMTSWAMNLTCLEEAQGKGFDEVILLNERGEVAECTSANVFAAQGNQIWTPPLTAGCLPGVTRDLLLHQIPVPGFEIREKTLTPADLEAADEVFITSTTRGLLPVYEIDQTRLRHEGRAQEALQKEFRAYVEKYVAEHRTPVKA